MNAALEGVSIRISETAGIARSREPIRIGIPLPRGCVQDPTALTLVDTIDRPVVFQADGLDYWPDRSVRWLLVDALVATGAGQNAVLTLRGKRPGDSVLASARVDVVARGDTITVDTGVANSSLRTGGPSLVETVIAGSQRQLKGTGISARLIGARGAEYYAVVQEIRVEEAGPVRATLLIEGAFRDHKVDSGLRFRARLVFIAGDSDLRIEVIVHNPRAARHPGGLWDLADRGTVLFRDLSLVVAPEVPVESIRWTTDRLDRPRSDETDAWVLYQDSSGGENWDSDNHVDESGQLAVRFRGYRVTTGTPGGMKLIAEGDRARPSVSLRTRHGSIGVGVSQFWENFPKSIRFVDQRLSIGLFPGEFGAFHAIQGGEQKRHSLLLAFGPGDGLAATVAWQNPLEVRLDPAWIEGTGVIDSFTAAACDSDSAYKAYIGSIVDGPQSFFNKRELIDEYGWRNFGDLYADHEAVQHRGVKPLVSHYNNQYDFLYGALVQHWRTGDARWRRLAEDAARHTVDIDIYHTDQDRPAFNHGLFWHTDHHMPAATATHRTYSRRNRRGPSYGGGPSNEHNYTTGLLHYYYLTGDREAAAAVRELADWVIAMDDGAQSPLALIDQGPTGLASKTVSDDYHKVGRGAANSINALLDAYQLSGERVYLDHAEGLVRRCIHPKDDIAALELDAPEYRWSYLVFLQVLGKYLSLKMRYGETGYMLQYARASLLHYARWMIHHEVPYKEILERVHLPTETWPAHDVRKAHVLNMASDFALPDERAALRAKARFFFDRSIAGVLSFDTAYFTRPRVILCVYGHVQAHYDRDPAPAAIFAPNEHSFGTPAVFESQRRRWRRALPGRLHRLLVQAGRRGIERLVGRRHYSTPTRL